MPAKTMFFLPFHCYWTLLSYKTAANIRKELWLSKYLFLEATKIFPRKFPHLGKLPNLSHWPELPHMGLLLLKHIEGGHQTVQLERSRREAEKWGKWLERQPTGSAISVYRTYREMNKTQNWSSEWIVLMYYKGSL